MTEIDMSLSAESAAVMADADELKRRFARNLERVMGERGMSQVDLARSISQSAASVNNYLSGTRAPGMRQLLEVARALSCDADELLADPDARPGQANERAPEGEPGPAGDSIASGGA